jgi:hypothetical protein
MIKLKYGQRNRTLRKRKAKGKLFRKKCEGCIVFRNHEEDGSTCPVPYKYMPLCPCQPCLVKVMCTRFCNKFNS